jgi:hypothetical protein
MRWRPWFRPDLAGRVYSAPSDTIAAFDREGIRRLGRNKRVGEERRGEEKDGRRASRFGGNIRPCENSSILKRFVCSSHVKNAM